ncbi:MAG TPA: alpha/beta hydrolase, partial [Sphingomonas sp.]|nr:alpha/beta hydrolase [Sphingomonas sp.]
MSGSRLAPRWVDAPNRSVAAAGTTFAYRRLGPAAGVPVLLLNHWGATLDNFDPRIVDGLAATRPVIAIDYRGVGASGGKAPRDVAEMARDMIACINALGLETVDLLGFSLGGFVAQDIVRQESGLIRKIILAGTGPAGGVGIAQVGAVSWPLIARAMLTLRDAKFYLFFTGTTHGRGAAQAFLDRLKERKTARDKPITVSAFLRQLKAIHAWGRQSPQDLGAIEKPVLVANGDQDIMVPSSNSIDLARRLPNAELVLYEDAGHGGIFQFHQTFTE